MNDIKNAVISAVIIDGVDKYIDDTHPPIRIFDNEYPVSVVLKKTDPDAYLNHTILFARGAGILVTDRIFEYMKKVIS